MPPPGIRVDEYSKMQDMQAIEKIKQYDPEGLIETVNAKNISMCGAGPIASMLYATKNLDCDKVELLKYGTSYEVQPSSSCVGYGALAVY
jgi:AmmeMemoRadiSam system protein B